MRNFIFAAIGGVLACVLVTALVHAEIVRFGSLIGIAFGFGLIAGIQFFFMILKIKS